MNFSKENIDFIHQLQSKQQHTPFISSYNSYNYFIGTLCDKNLEFHVDFLERI
jgi:hypothetical protein